MTDIQFVEGIIKGLVSFPDMVSVEKVVDDIGIMLNVRVDSQDVGRVIGRAGSTINAIRTIVRVFGITHDMGKMTVKVID